MGRTMGGVVGGVLVLASLAVGPAWAQSLRSDDIRYAQAAGVLVMPFDVTAGRVSFQIVSRIGGTFGAAPVATHWVYWSADCRHLADVLITLTELDTVVVDPTRLQGQTQTTSPPENHPQGPTVDLTGERGIAVVTVIGPVITPEIVGGWTIANPATGASFGGDAIGLADGSLPDPFVLAGGIRIPTFDPARLWNSEVILIGLESEGGNVHPIARPSDALGGARVCCDASVTDNLEVKVSIPDVCFDCVGFTAITPALAEDGVSGLAPDGIVLGSAGFVHLADCRSGTRDGGTAPVGSETPQFIVALHGQSVGPFGFVVTGKYSGAPPL